MNIALLRAVLFTPLAGGRWGLPALFTGEPGVAKSAVIESFAASVGLACETLSPGERGEGAFGVVPVPVKGVLTYPAPDWTVRMSDAGIVFLDEVTTAPPALQAPMLGLIAARRIGSTSLAKRVRVVGACNPADVAANGHDLSSPLNNRFCHLKWSAPSVDEHAAFMMSAGHNDQADAPADACKMEADVLARWPDAWARAVGLETAFLRAQPQMKNRCPKATDATAPASWPSDRTWEMGTRALASAAIHGLTDTERDELVGGCIGLAALESFAAFIESADLPNPGDVLDGKTPWKHEPARLDRTAAVLAACAALVSPKQAQNRQARGEKLWELLEGVGRSAQDVVVPVAQQLVTSHLFSTGKDKASTRVLDRIQTTLAAEKNARR